MATTGVTGQQRETDQWAGVRSETFRDMPRGSAGFFPTAVPRRPFLGLPGVDGAVALRIPQCSCGSSRGSKYRASTSVAMPATRITITRKKIPTSSMTAPPKPPLNWDISPMNSVPTRDREQRLYDGLGSEVDRESDRKREEIDRDDAAARRDARGSSTPGTPRARVAVTCDSRAAATTACRA